MPYRLIVHCGLHKTGTTALQHFLSQHDGQWRAAGVLVPRTGRLEQYGGGHHNIAWQLNRDRRFDPRLGTLGELIEEIAGFDGDAVISSEDFETCLTAPARLAPLLHHPRLAGRDSVLLIYLRNQISAAEALFTENVGHGFGEECAQVMQAIVAHGDWVAREWRFQFDYRRLWETAAMFAPATVLFRAHCPPAAGGIVADFMRCVFPGIPLVEPGAAPKVHTRLNFRDALIAFHTNRTGCMPDRREDAVLRVLAQQAGDAEVLLPTVLRRLFQERFMPGNRAICQAAGLPLEALDLLTHGAPPGPHALLMDRVFSFETPVVIAGLAGLLPEDDTQPWPDAAGLLFRAILEAWRSERPLP